MADDANPISDRFNRQPGQPPPSKEPYNLGEPAKKAYASLGMGKEQVLQRGRDMSFLTIQTAIPPQNYKAGDPLPGNNQSIGAQLVATLASKLMFQAFPPGQPMMRYDAVEAKLQAAIDADPQLWGKIELALSRLEVAHRKKAAAVGLAFALLQYYALMLIGGNALWKQVTLDSPSVFGMENYVVSRDRGGHQMVIIHEEVVRVVTLDEDLQEHFYERMKGLSAKSQWEQEVTIYSCCRFVAHSSGRREKGSWEYWQEDEWGNVLEDTSVETDYDDCPMWAGWLIPVFGSNWGEGYCFRFRADLEAVESSSSNLTDGAALAAWALTFVRPGGSTTLRQVNKARNLAVLPGVATDVSVFRSEKTSDLTFVDNRLDKITRRLGAAFLSQSAAFRQGERVTAEEVTRVGLELDQGLGGIYTGLSTNDQRRIIQRFIHLHLEAEPDLDVLPAGLTEVQVTTGVDAMGRSLESQALRDAFADINVILTPTSTPFLEVAGVLNRVFSSRGIKPDGLVKKAEKVAAEQQEQRSASMGADVAKGLAGPVGGALAKGAMDQMAPPSGGAPAAPQQGA